jgi:tetratricopeptide (TPR) repeat protein
MSNEKSKRANAPQSAGSAAPAPAASAAAPAKTDSLPPRLPPLFRPIDWATFVVTTLVVWTGYFLTLAPNLTLEDSGELAVASFYAGIPHPPGYPVWTIYTWLWATLLPISNVAWRVALGSATAGALACGLLAFLVSRGSSMMIEGIADLKNINRRWESAICMVSGFVAGTLLGFNGYFWSQSVIVEVYSLSVLSLVAVLLGLLRWTYAPEQYRYLYLAFFMYGICFNNHQSLLVIAMSMEALVLVVQPKLARALFFWNTIVYLGGLAIASMGYLKLLSENTPVFVIYNIIGLASGALWVWLSWKTKLRALEFGRDLALVGSLGYVALLLGVLTNYVDAFDDSRGGLLLVHLVGLGCIAAFVRLERRARGLGREWRVALGAAGAWLLGAAFYFYMPIAGMTNPPMQWGYPRTVEGFFHAITRGQYERIRPTTGAGDTFVEATFNFVKTYATQLWMFLEGLNEEFNLVYLAIALVIFFFYGRMQRRERAWAVGLVAFFLTLGPFLVMLLNPPPDRAARELIRVFFTASHTVVAMAVGYGLTLLAATLATQYERLRHWALAGGVAATLLALAALAGATQDFVPEHLQAGPLHQFVHAIRKSFDRDQYAMPIFAGLMLVGGALLYTGAVVFKRHRPPLALTLALFAAMPVYSVLTHWFENEQRGHLFGYWFGHDMFTPPFTGPDGKFGHYDAALREQMMRDPVQGKYVYPEMTRDAVLYGGTDPGRFCPTYMIFCESFIPPRCKKDTDPHFDRRDVYIITQNALADGTYLNYIRAHYNRSRQVDPPFFQDLLRGPKERELNYTTNLLARLAYAVLDRPFLALGAKIEARRRREGVYPPKEIYIATPDDSQRCFQEYLYDAQRRAQHDRDFPHEPRQLKPGEDVRIVDNKVQVSGQVAVMSINALIAKVMFDQNPTNEFFVEESFPLDWMYPHLTPFGIIMKVNRKPLPDLSEDILARDHEFWSRYSERLIGNWITYDTSVRDIARFAEKLYLRRDFSGFQGDRKFARDDQAQKAFSKLRSSIAGVYLWRLFQAPPEYRPKTPEEFQRLLREADFAFKQAFAFCPFSPEAVFRYVTLLTQPQVNRFEDALLVAETCRKLDPYNAQVVGLVNSLRETVRRFGEIEKIRSNFDQMEAALAKNPTDFQGAFNLASAYLAVQQTNRALAVLERLIQHPQADGNAVLSAARVFADLHAWPQLETALERLVKILPETPETWYDLAALKSGLGKVTEGMDALRRALELNAKRLAQDPKASNLAYTARDDPRFIPLRALPEFQKLVSAPPP